MGGYSRKHGKMIGCRGGGGDHTGVSVVEFLVNRGGSAGSPSVSKDIGCGLSGGESVFMITRPRD
jgi:hypothetical protein